MGARGSIVRPSGTNGLLSATSIKSLLLPTTTTHSPSSFSTSATTVLKYRFCHDEGQQGGKTSFFSFAPVPSKEEAKEAVFVLQRLFIPKAYSQISGNLFPSVDKNVIDHIWESAESIKGVSSIEPVLNQTKFAKQLHHPKDLQSQAQEKFFDAFRLLQFDPSVQRMVLSLSTDKAVWDAVKKNEVVQELQKSWSTEKSKTQNSDGCPDIGSIILRWILETAKGKIMELIDTITNLVNELFHSRGGEKDMNILDDVVRSSFMLSVMVFIVVIVTRIQ